MVAVDEKGEEVDGDKVMGLLALVVGLLPAGESAIGEAGLEALAAARAAVVSATASRITTTSWSTTSTTTATMAAPARGGRQAFCKPASQAFFR